NRYIDRIARLGPLLQVQPPPQLVSRRWRKLAAASARPRRLLWASAGTKDPQASDRLYAVKRESGFAHRLSGGPWRSSAEERQRWGSELPARFLALTSSLISTQKFSLSFFMEENRRPRASSGLLC